MRSSMKEQSTVYLNQGELRKLKEKDGFQDFKDEGISSDVVINLLDQPEKAVVLIDAVEHQVRIMQLETTLKNFGIDYQTVPGLMDQYKKVVSFYYSLKKATEDGDASGSVSEAINKLGEQVERLQSVVETYFKND